MKYVALRVVVDLHEEKCNAFTTLKELQELSRPILRVPYLLSKM